MESNNSRYFMIFNHDIKIEKLFIRKGNNALVAPANDIEGDGLYITDKNNFIYLLKDRVIYFNGFVKSYLKSRSNFLSNENIKGRIVQFNSYI